MISSLYIHSMNILTPSGASDGMGGVTQTWGISASGVPCRLRVLGGGLRRTNMADEVLYDATVFTAPAEITESMRLDVNGSLFDIVSIVPAYHGFTNEIHHMRIDAKRVA